MAIPKIYLSSRFATSGTIERQWLKRTGCKYRCFSYANLTPEFKGYFSKNVVEGYQACVDEGIGIMMDSSAHSFHVLQQSTQQRGVQASKRTSLQLNEEDLKEMMFNGYVGFCKKYKKDWDFYVTLDYKRHQPTIYAMQKRFQSIGLKPVPVYHGDDSLDWLRKYMDMGHTFISIATSRELRPSYKRKRYFLDKVFEFGAKHKLRFHGLAFTSMAFLIGYPWYSVDSSTWTKCAAYGLITVPDIDRNILGTLHISEKHAASKSYNDLDKRHKDAVRRWIKDLGFDLQKLRTDHHARHDFNGWIFSNLDKLGLDFSGNNKKTVEWGGIL